MASDNILDIGPESILKLPEAVVDAKFVLWNGPLGKYEEGFDTTTKALAQSIAQSSANTFVGGGDTLAAISGLQLEKQYSFTSTGGGAMLEFLLNGTLPGIKALDESL